MHFITKLIHFVRVNFFKILIVILICILIHQLKEEPSSLTDELLTRHNSHSKQLGQNDVLQVDAKFKIIGEKIAQSIEVRQESNDEINTQANTGDEIQKDEVQKTTTTNPTVKDIKKTTTQKLPAGIRMISSSADRKELMKKLREQFNITLRKPEDYLKYISKLNSKPPELKFVYLNKEWNTGGGPEDYYKRVVSTPKPTGKYECYEWEYDAADFTLFYKPFKRFQNETCSYPKNETVKKIVMPNKEIVWKGCTQKTSACYDGARFDPIHNLRRNTPPCCRKHLLEMLKNIDAELTRRNVSYMLAAGAVIGWFRNGKLVPYDGDLDMFIDGNYFRTQIWDDIFDTLSKKFGYVYVKLEEYKAKLKFSKTNSLAVDIWPYYNIKLRTQYGENPPGEWLNLFYHTGSTAIRADRMVPPRRTKIEGVDTFIPRDPMNYLNKNYGPTPVQWLPEMTCKTSKQGNCNT